MASTLPRSRVNKSSITIQQRLAMHSIPVPESGCHLWTGFCDEKGYGRMVIRYRKFGAHRIAYELAKGKIPDGKQIDHLCRVRCCINPDHLEAVTLQENILRGEGIAVQRAKQTHCIHGHELSGDNLLPNKKNRQCKTCAQAYRRMVYRTKGGGWDGEYL